VTSWVFRPMAPRLAVIYAAVMSSLPPEIDDQVAYSLDEARRYLSHGNKRRAADELQFAAERAVEPRHFSAIYQLAASSRKTLGDSAVAVGIGYSRLSIGDAPTLA
jgi:hypothetical protein